MCFSTDIGNLWRLKVWETDCPNCVEFWSNSKHHNNTPHLSISQQKEGLFLTGENWCGFKYCTLKTFISKKIGICMNWYQLHFWNNTIFVINGQILIIFWWNIPMYEFKFQIFGLYWFNFSNLNFLVLCNNSNFYYVIYCIPHIWP